MGFLTEAALGSEGGVNVKAGISSLSLLSLSFNTGLVFNWWVYQGGFLSLSRGHTYTILQRKACCPEPSHFLCIRLHRSILPTFEKVLRGKGNILYPYM